MTLSRSTRSTLYDMGLSDRSTSIAAAGKMRNAQILALHCTNAEIALFDHCSERAVRGYLRALGIRKYRNDNFIPIRDRP